MAQTAIYIQPSGTRFCVCRDRQILCTCDDYLSAWVARASFRGMA